jgi:hypothetical protein
MIQLPLDTGNTGKKVRTQSRVIGADTVHEHFYVQPYPRDAVGFYSVHSGRLAVLAAAHAATAGFFWILNPVGAAVQGALRRVEFTAAPVAATVFASTPRITAERMTFTGTASGATLTPARRDSTDAAPTLTVRTASTGITPAAAEIVRGWLVPPVLTAVGVPVPVDLVWQPNDVEEEVILRPGEGIVFRQADAGTAADTRIAVVDVSWSEFTP